MWEALACAGLVLLINIAVLGPFMYFAIQAEDCQSTGNKAYITHVQDHKNP